MEARGLRLDELLDPFRAFARHCLRTVSPQDALWSQIQQGRILEEDAALLARDARTLGETLMACGLAGSLQDGPVEEEAEVPYCDELYDLTSIWLANHTTPESQRGSTQKGLDEGVLSPAELGRLQQACVKAADMLDTALRRWVKTGLSGMFGLIA
ncbi:MAG TPA: hypothetical protein VGN26_14150 [Armatimonadota bacterium]|jgi:hypothetical protein